MFSPRLNSILGTGLALLTLASCSVPQRFTCEDDDQCGEGQCVLGGCAFPDDECPSGLRYGELSNDAGECTELDPVAEGESGTAGSETLVTEESGSEESGSEESGSETETGSETGEPEPEEPQVLAHYTLDSGEVIGLVVIDSSDNELHALAQSVQPQPPGVSGECLEFQPLSRIEIPLEVLEGLDEFTFECYVRDATMVNMVLSNIFYFGNPDNATEPPAFALYLGLLDEPAGTMRVYWNGEEELTFAGMTDFTASPGWHHLGFTAGPGGIRLYVDHELEIAHPLMPAWVDAGMTSLSIGALPTLDGGFEGLLDELRFSDQALEPEQMLPLP